MLVIYSSLRNADHEEDLIMMLVVVLILQFIIRVRFPKNLSLNFSKVSLRKMLD